jgi:hypothetical protein
MNLVAAGGVARGWDPEFESALLQRRVACEPECLDQLLCFPVAVFFLLIEVIDRHEAAPPLEGLAEGGLALNPLGFGVDVCKADFRAKPRC